MIQIIKLRRFEAEFCSRLQVERGGEDINLFAKSPDWVACEHGNEFSGSVGG